MTRHGWNISDYDAEIDRLKKRIVKLEANLAKAVAALEKIRKLAAIVTKELI